MKLEMEGREPLLVIFGLPVVTTAIVLGSMYFGHQHRDVIPPPPITVEAPQVSPRITAEIPQGAIRITNEVPPAQIHEVIKEVVRVPDVNVTNRVEPTRPPDVHINVPRQESSVTRYIAIPTPVPMPMPTPVSTEPPPDEPDTIGADGKLLPPPKPDAVKPPAPAPAKSPGNGEKK